MVKVAALCQIGDTYQDSAEYQKAIQTYDGILKEYPDTFYSDYVQYQLGLSLLKSSQYDSAVVAFQKLKAGFPDSKLVDDATYALGLAYFQRENYAASREVFSQFQREFKDSPLRAQATYLLGTSWFNQGKYAEAVEVFKDVVRLYGDDQDLVQKAEYEIADCYYQMGNEKEAMTRFKALRTKYPDSSLTAEVMWWLGEYYFRHKDLVLARRYFSSLIQDYSKSPLVTDAYFALASIDVEEDKPREAIEKFKKVMALGKTDLAGTAAISIADVYAKMEQYGQALDALKETVARNANLAPFVYPKMGDIYRTQAQFDEALHWYRKALEIVPVRETSRMQFRIGEVLEQQQRYGQAIEEYLKVPYLFSETSELSVKAYLRVASLYEEQEKLKDAAAVYAKLAGMNVDESKYARERIEWINNVMRGR
jgi:TolA-binding protein